MKLLQCRETTEELELVKRVARPVGYLLWFVLGVNQALILNIIIENLPVFLANRLTPPVFLQRHQRIHLPKSDGVGAIRAGPAEECPPVAAHSSTSIRSTTSGSPSPTYGPRPPPRERAEGVRHPSKSGLRGRCQVHLHRARPRHHRAPHLAVLQVGRRRCALCAPG